MTDYWEAIGRLAYEAKLFAEFENSLPKAESIEYETIDAPAWAADAVRAETPPPTYTGLKLSPTQLEGIQKFLKSYLTEQRLSLFSAGELLWTFNHKDSRTAFLKVQAAIAKAAEPHLSSPSSSFFVSLGIAVVDKHFREKLKASDPNHCDDILPRLSPLEKLEILTIGKDQDFRRAADDQDGISWNESCYESVDPFRGYVHPVAAKYLPKRKPSVEKEKPYDSATPPPLERPKGASAG
jgi:hypothetical protein